MSDNSSNTESTRSAAEIRQDIADYVLKHTDELSGVPGVKEFVEEHGRLTKEIIEGEDRLERLAKAKEEYEPLEKRVTASRKSLEDAEAELAKLYRPLGTTAFKAFIAGDVEDQSVFADRLTAHKRIQELQQERDELAPAADAGLAQKAKAKAQQLAVTGKIKIKELKFGGLDTELGRLLIETNKDEVIKFDHTSTILVQVDAARNSISTNAEELNESVSVFQNTTTALCEMVGLQGIDGAESWDREQASCSKSIVALENELHALLSRLSPALRKSDLSSLDATLRSYISELDSCRSTTLPLPLPGYDNVYFHEGGVTVDATSLVVHGISHPIEGIDGVRSCPRYGPWMLAITLMMAAINFMLFFLIVPLFFGGALVLLAVLMWTKFSELRYLTIVRKGKSIHLLKNRPKEFVEHVVSVVNQVKNM